MKNRIPISEAAVEADMPTRRSALTRLARIAKACGAITVFGLAPEIAYASGCVAYYNKNPSDVNFDGQPHR
jgi:hypothetical protein